MLMYVNALTLSEIVELSEKQSLNHKVYDLKLKELEEQLKLNRLSLLPELNIVAGQEKTFYDSKTESEDLLFGELRLNLFNGNKNRKQADRLKLLNDRQKLSLDQSRISIRQKVQETYFAYNYFSLFEKSIKQLEARNSAHIKMIEKRLRSGIGNESDLLEYQYSKKKIGILRKKIKERRIGLKILLGLMISKEVSKFTVNLIDKKSLQKIEIKEELFKELSKNKDIREFNLTNQESKLDRNIIKSSLYPAINLELRHGRQGEQFTGVSNRFVSTSAALTLTWGIDDFFKSKKLLDLSRSVSISNEYVQKQMEKKLRVDLSRVQLELKSLVSENNGLNESMDLAQSLYKKVLAEYRRGIKDSSSLVSASNEIFEIEKSLIKNQKKYYEILQETESILGKKII